ncbi:MAG: outer membrane beta-barrel protein [Bacteroidales bacterium]|jgi:hypothetical protein|nr:outer membrane beta-barrel protein [Bacteroidales bacterium]OQB61035.1 MAG: hypothetical protein BWX96_01911 [Bacteroidetes bacterium ADurb.Bin145]HOU03071.1 outer membrane beta-barrel protein [Bacteroidales bacterium]HQK68494.1 outer membrane beta-barrel protein [Bacteroidales bacterium]
MKHFDDIFKENVEKVFSSFNADHLADEGWNSFVVRQKGQRRRAVIIPLWARAASVLLIIGLGIFFTYKVTTKHSARGLISGNESAVQEAEEIGLLNEGKKTPVPVIIEKAEPFSRKERIELRTTETRQTSSTANSISEPVVLSEEYIIVQEDTESRFMIPSTITVLPDPGISGKPLHNLISETLTTGLETNDSQRSEKETGSRYGGRILMAGLSGLSAQSGGKASPASGLSVGLYLDQKLTKKISIRPGLALAMQSFVLDNGSIPTGINNPISLNDGTNGSLYSSEGQFSMLAMEVPLNLVFRIVEKKRSVFYVSAGASSMIYLSQQFKVDFVNKYTKESYNSTTDELSYETNYSTVRVENDYGALRRADFFGLANLSAGYSFPYSKTGTLLIEPFLQVPVSDLTSLDLRLRYAGISMKMQFGKKPRDN